MKKVKTKVLVVFAAIFLFISTSCNVPNAETETQEHSKFSTSKTIEDDSIDTGPIRGGELAIFSTTPDTFNPLITNNIYVQDFSNLIFESLVKFDKNQKPTPNLSDVWTISPDGLTWNFHIRQKVYWQDGSTLSASDVEYSMEVILNASNNSVYKTLLSNIATFGVVDRQNFRIQLKKQNYFTAELMTFPIISKKINLKVGVDPLAKPIGTGPYRFDEHVKNATEPYIVFKRNKNWWNKKNPDPKLPDFPYIDVIKVKIKKESKAAVNAFLSKEIDVTYVNSNDYDKYSSRTDLTIKKYPSRNFEFLAFNTTKPILKDNQLRLAISKLLDINKIVTSCYGNSAIQAAYPLYPLSWISSGLKPIGRDTSGGLEILKDYSNKRLKLDLIVNSENKKRPAVAEEIANQLKLYDITVNIEKVTWDEQIKRIQENKFDMAIMGYNVPLIPDMSYLYSLPYLSENYLNPIEGVKATNIAKYMNPEVDGYIQRIFSQRDSGLQQAYVINLAGLLEQEVPYLGLCFTNNAILANRRIRGKIDPLPWNRLNNVVEWYIPTTKM